MRVLASAAASTSKRKKDMKILNVVSPQWKTDHPEWLAGLTGKKRKKRGPRNQEGILLANLTNTFIDMPDRSNMRRTLTSLLLSGVNCEFAQSTLRLSKSQVRKARRPEEVQLAAAALAVKRAPGTRERQHPILCWVIADFMMYGTPREIFVLPMSKQDAYIKFRAQYIDMVKSCAPAIKQGDNTAFAQKVRASCLAKWKWGGQVRE